MATKPTVRPILAGIVLALLLAGWLIARQYAADSDAKTMGGAPDQSSAAANLPLPGPGAHDSDRPARVQSSNPDSLGERIEADALPQKSLQELIEQARHKDPTAAFEEMLASAQAAPLTDGAYRIGGSNQAHLLPLAAKPGRIALRIEDDGVMRGDADPVARFTGPSGRWTLSAVAEDGAITLGLPEKTLQAGVYILDINPHNPRTSRQRRYILKLAGN